LVVVFAISGLMVPTYSMTAFAQTDEEVPVIDALVYSGGELTKELLDFWKIVKWYLNLANYYDDRWDNLVNLIANFDVVIDDYVACLGPGGEMNLLLVEAFPEIQQIYADKVVTDQEIEQFVKEHPALMASAEEYGMCMLDFETKHEINQLMDADEVIVIHVALEVEDYKYRVSGLDELIGAAGDETGIDLNTLRRDNVALSTLVGYKFIKAVSGAESVKAASMTANMGSEMLKIFGKTVAKKQFFTLLKGKLFESTDDVPLPAYLQSVKKTTDDLENCAPKIVGIDTFDSCMNTLGNNLNTLSKPFVSMEQGIERCFESAANTKLCEEHISQKFGPPLSHIKDNVTLLVQCVTFEGDTDKCSSLLEIDRNIYSVIKECGTPENEVACVNAISNLYTISGVDAILADITGAATCIADTTAMCMASDEYPPQVTFLNNMNLQKRE